jgi:nifR3 family TIM-barrel protein
MSHLLDQLKKNPFVLAPMAGITDVAFRSYMRSMGSSVVVTELVSATGIKYQSQKTLDLMRFSESQRPIGIQIFGDSLEDFAYATKAVEDARADFVDLNFGCPVPKVVKKGAGSAILKDLIRVAQVFQTVKSATKLPVTVKIRTGWDEGSKVAKEICRIAYEEGLTWVAIHGRTRAQGYSGFADWEYIKDVKKESKIPVLGNGDICNPIQAVEKLIYSDCDGVLIGRGCLKNPWIFDHSLKLYKKYCESKTSQNSLVDKDDSDLIRTLYHLNKSEFNTKLEYLKVFEALNESYGQYFPERIQSLQLKKLSAWYSFGLPDSSTFRKEIFQSQEKKDVWNKISDYFGQYNHFSIESNDNDGFLMGGHG